MFIKEDDNVGVVVPVFAHKKSRLIYLKKCLESLKRQQINFKSYVIDDGSPLRDDVRSLIDCINDKRINLVERERSVNDRKTASNAINMGLEMFIQNNDVSYVCYLHSDDGLPKDSLKQRLKGDFSYSRFLAFKDNNPLKIKGFSKMGFKNGYHSFPHHASMWSIEFLKELKKYNKNVYNQESIFDPLIAAGEDRDVTLSSMELAEIKDIIPRFVSNIGYFYRIQDDSITVEMEEKKIKEDMERIDEKHGYTKFLYSLALHRMFTNLPWSLGTCLPINIKEKLRPIKNYFENRNIIIQCAEYVDDPFFC
ncbi:MAG: glycosyltransferase family A protein [Nanobdellota archaeon]